MLLRNLKPDIALLQESHIKQNNNAILHDKTFPYQWHSNGSSKSRSMVILLNQALQFQETGFLKDSQGRYVVVKGILNGESVTIASIYAPNTSQIPFLDSTLQKLTDFGDSTLIITGDYNYIVDLKLDRSHNTSDA